MKNKILDIKKEIEKIISTVSKEKFDILWYGAYDINPKHLVFWICVKTDSEKLRLELNTELMKSLKELLVKHDYPEMARESVHIGFESQETIDRESDGDLRLHFN
jgi:hypothetical protein